MIIGRDLREANLHIEATGSYNDGTAAHDLHGLGSSDGVVVGTTATQTLTNKTLTSPVLTGTLENDASITFEGATADAYETTLTVVDPTADRTITLPNATGTVVLKDTVDTLTNKTLTSPTISGSPVITGLSSAGMSASSAAPKDYVDSILGSATAASTSAASAATSASSAATSATSAATSASLALTSANSAATSATAAATSATSAAASATAAATSASSAAAATSAVVTSAASAATSASSAATSASSALTSQTAATTSASSAATSATAAATSASSAATSASSAATSATSAATTYTAYDARYLGSKATAPTVDNLGGALITGATYWNSATNLMYAWSGSAWQAISTTSSYSAPTLGSTTISSGATVSNVNGLTINSTTIPTSKTLVVTTDKLSALAATTSAELAGIISDETGSGALVFGSSPTLSPAAAANIGLTVKGAASQTANLQEWQDSAGVVLATVSSGGTIKSGAFASPTDLGSYINFNSTSGAMFVGTRAASNIGIIVKGAASQSANLQEWQDSAGTVLAKVTSTGTVTGTPTAGTTSTATTGFGYMGLPQNATTTGAATIAAADAGKHIYSTATRTLTIDSNANLALPVGTTITFVAGSGATVTIAITTDTMYLAGPGTTGSRTLAAFGMATAVKIASTTWIISGNGLT
jgi:hypothetical protein